MHIRDLFAAFTAAIGLAACTDSTSTSGAVVLRQIAFETRVDVPTGLGQVSDLVLADLDGDLDLDLAVAGAMDRLVVLLNDGRGRYHPGQTVAVAGQPLKIIGADVDADGDVDLAVLSGSASELSVLRNDGRATFAASAVLPVGRTPAEVVAGDCDGDGVVDLVVSQLSVGDLVLFAGRGDGTFAAPGSIALPPGSIAAGLRLDDVSSDGQPDLLVTEVAQNQLLVLHGIRGGGYAPPVRLPVGMFPIAVTTGDLDLDGVTDIAVSSFGSREITVFHQRGGSLVSSLIPVAAAPANLIVADVTNDGRNDLVACSLDRSCVSVHPGTAAGALGRAVEMATGGVSFRPASGDIDGDGRRDLVVTNNGLDSVAVFAGRPALLPTAALNDDVGIALPEFVAAADLDGDGRAEIAAVSSQETYVSILDYRHDGVSLRADLRQRFDMGNRCFNVLQRDFNGDGRVDLAISTEGGVRLLANESANGVLALRPVPAKPGEHIISGFGPFEVASADFDRDGLLDLIVTDSWAETLTVARAIDGDFHFEPNPMVLTLAGQPTGLAAADFDGDQLPDVAVSRYRSATVSVFRNNGAGGLDAWRDVPVGGGPNYLRAADFNADGRSDLVVSNASTGEITLLFGQLGGFATQALPAGPTPTALLARDFTGDGFHGLLVGSLVGAEFRVLLGDGRGGFPGRLIFAGSHKAISADLADIDGDLRLDLMVASIDASAVTLYRNVSN